MRDLDDTIEAMLGDFVANFAGALLVEFEAAYFAQAAAAFGCAFGRRISVEDGACGCVCKGAASSTGFDDC